MLKASEPRVRGNRRRASRQPACDDLLTLPLHLAWLLRDDVRGDAALDDIEAQRNFLCWWVLYGQREYPAAPPLEPRHLDAVVEEVAVPEHPAMRLPRIALYVWRRMAPADRPRALRNAREAARFVALVWLQVIRPAGADATLPLARFPALLAPDEESTRHGALPITRLMRFLWDTDPALRRRFDLETAAGQDGLTQWCAQSVTHASKPVTVAPRAALPRTALRADGVNLVGFAAGEFGLGEDVRMLAAALDAAAVPYCVIACDPLRATGRADTALQPVVREQPEYDITLFCMSGFDTATVALRAPELFDVSRYRVGCWPWELPQWPDAWRIAYGLVDEVWASSRFTAAAFKRNAPCPVQRFPLAVSIDRIVLRHRDYFGLPTDRFLFLYMFDAHSYLARKNPATAVAAFKAAFPRGDEPVGLVLKTMIDDRSDDAFVALLTACADDPRIRLIDDTLPRGDALGLIAACDAYLSLHRAEGFGRTIAEAMLLRRPVIATGFSGSNELITGKTGIAVNWRERPVGPREYPFAAGQVWAEPDIADAADAMRRIAADPGLRQRLSEAAYRRVAQIHAPEAVGAVYAARLDALRARLRGEVTRPA